VPGLIVAINSECFGKKCSAKGDDGRSTLLQDRMGPACLPWSASILVNLFGEGRPGRNHPARSVRHSGFKGADWEASPSPEADYRIKGLRRQMRFHPLPASTIDHGQC